MNIIAKAASSSPLCAVQHKLRAHLWGVWIYTNASPAQPQGQLVRFYFTEKMLAATQARVLTPDSKNVPTWLLGLIDQTWQFFNSERPLKFKLAKVPFCFAHFSKFAHEVYAALQQAQEPLSYSDLAFKSGHPKSVRALATAVGKNPFPLYIPCHRVVTAQKLLGNYTGPGKSRLKLELLLRENHLWHEKKFHELSSIKNLTRLPMTSLRS